MCLPHHSPSVTLALRPRSTFHTLLGLLSPHVRVPQPGCLPQSSRPDPSTPQYQPPSMTVLILLPGGCPLPGWTLIPYTGCPQAWLPPQPSWALMPTLEALFTLLKLAAPSMDVLFCWSHSDTLPPWPVPCADGLLLCTGLDPLPNPFSPYSGASSALGHTASSPHT